MQIKTLCYQCKTAMTVGIRAASTCACGAKFVAIPTFAELHGHSYCKALWHITGQVPVSGLQADDELRELLREQGVTLLSDVTSFPMFVDLSGDRNVESLKSCRFDCSWGANYVHLESHPQGGAECGYLIFPLEHLDESTTLYHGTTPEGANRIFGCGLLLSPKAAQKTHGLASEGDLRYVGIEIGPAKSHDKGAIIELSHNGSLAKTHLGLPPKALQHLLGELKGIATAVSFWEDGKSAAFGRDGNVCVKSSEHNTAVCRRIAPQPPPRPSLIEFFKRWIGALGKTTEAKE